eukprot:Filipodium_phascolosomae@DN5774_c0_g1_i1.p1
MWISRLPVILNIRVIVVREYRGSNWFTIFFSCSTALTSSPFMEKIHATTRTSTSTTTTTSSTTILAITTTSISTTTTTISSRCSNSSTTTPTCSAYCGNSFRKNQPPFWHPCYTTTTTTTTITMLINSTM